MRVYVRAVADCLTLAQEREIRIVGELKQSRESHKRDLSKLSSERDALEDAGACARACAGGWGGGEGAARGVTQTAVLELNAKLKEAEVKRISAEEKLKLLDAQLQRAQHQVRRCTCAALRWLMCVSDLRLF